MCNAASPMLLDAASLLSPQYDVCDEASIPIRSVLDQCNHPSLIVSSPLISDQGCNYYYRNRNYLMSFVQRKYLDNPQSRTVELGKLLSYLLNLGSGEGKLLWSNRAAHGVVLLQLFNPTLHGGEGVIMTPYQL